MRKIIYLFLSTVTLLTVFNSCKNDNLDLDKILKFSKLSVEEQKNSIEQNGIALMDKMDEMKTTKAMIALEVFISQAQSNSSFAKPLEVLRSNLLRNNLNSLETFNSQMRVAAAESDDIWGVWTWNPTDKDFIQVKGVKNTITFNFPATENSTNNTGELKIIYVPSQVIVPDTDPVEFMPSSISVILKVSGTVALSADFSGDYKSDATPTKLSQNLVIDSYNWNLEFTNNDKDVSTKYAFKYNKEVLLKYELGAAGSFTANEIENKINAERPQDILLSGSMYVQVLDIAFLGGITDFKGFAYEMDGLKTEDEKAEIESTVSIFNKYIKMYGFFVNEDRKFADVEFYSSEKQGIDYNYNTRVLVYTQLMGQAPPPITLKYDFIDYDYVYNSTTQNYDYIQKYYKYGTKTYYSFQPRLVLSDGSKVDVENYFESGFEDLISKLDSYQKK